MRSFRRSQRLTLVRALPIILRSSPTKILNILYGNCVCYLALQVKCYILHRVPRCQSGRQLITVSRCSLSRVSLRQRPLFLQGSKRFVYSLIRRIVSRRFFLLCHTNTILCPNGRQRIARRISRPFIVRVTPFGRLLSLLLEGHSSEGGNFGTCLCQYCQDLRLVVSIIHRLPLRPTFLLFLPRDIFFFPRLICALCYLSRLRNQRVTHCTSRRACRCSRPCRDPINLRRISRQQ